MTELAELCACFEQSGFEGQAPTAEDLSLLLSLTRRTATTLERTLDELEAQQA